MEYHELMALIEERVGLDGLANDAQDGVCHLMYKDVPVTIKCVSDNRRILTTLPVAPIPTDADTTFYRQLNTANCMYQKTEGMTLFINQEETHVWMGFYDFLHEITLEEYIRHFTKCLLMYNKISPDLLKFLNEEWNGEFVFPTHKDWMTFENFIRV